MSKKASNRFGSHPLHDLYFFESPFKPETLNGKKIRLQCRHRGQPYDGVFTMRAWAHPRLSGFLGLKAQGESWRDWPPTVNTISFDSYRASKIVSATHEGYEFEAELAEFQPLQQVSHIWAAVRADFDREVAKIGPILEMG